MRFAASIIAGPTGKSAWTWRNGGRIIWTYCGRAIAPDQKQGNQMRKSSYERKPSDTDGLTEKDFSLLPDVIVNFVASDHAKLLETGLSDNGTRVARAIACTLASINLARTAYAKNNPDFYIQQSLDEADALIMALLEGRNHPAIQYFQNRRKKGQPKKDFFAMRPLEMAVGCYFKLIEAGSTKNKALRDIEAALRGLPSAVAAIDIENYLKENYASKTKSVKRPSYPDAQAAVEGLFDSALAKAKNENASIQPLELLVLIWEHLGPNRNPSRGK